VADLRLPRATVAPGGWSWLLTVRLAGRDVRLTSGPDVDIDSDVDGVRRYLSGLTTDGLARALDVFADGPSERSASFAVALSFDLAEAVEQGHAIHGARGELSQWWPGTKYEDRRVVLEGVIREPAYGDASELVAFTLRESLGEDRGRFWDAGEVVTRDTFPAGIIQGGPLGSDDVDGLWGNAYPIVLGVPGVGHVESAGGVLTHYDIAATPALLVEQQVSTTPADFRLMVCRGVAADIGDRVEIVNASATGKNFWGTLTVGKDQTGRDYTYVSPSGLASIPDKSDNLWATWVDRAATPPETTATQNPFAVGALRGAGDVIRWALALSTLRIDRSQAGRLAGLNGFRVDTYINDPTARPWPWVRDTLLPLLPASAVSGPDGLYVTTWDYDATPDDAVERLEVGRNCARSLDSLVTYGDEGAVVNEVSVQFALDGATGQYTRTITIGDTWEEHAVSPLYPSIWARRSRQFFGRRAQTVTAGWVYDYATAEAIGAHLLRRSALPPRRVAVTADAALAWLRPGDVVAFTDRSLSLIGRAAHVEAVASSESGQVEVGLILFESLTYPEA